MRIKNSETLYKDYYRKIGFPLKNGYYSIKHQKKKKDLLLLATKQVKKYLILLVLNNTIKYF